MFGITQEIGFRFIAFNVGIDKCKDFVVRYRPCVLWCVYAGIINNEDLAVHVLKHELLAANHAKDEDGI